MMLESILPSRKGHPRLARRRVVAWFIVCTMFLLGAVSPKAALAQAGRPAAAHSQGVLPDARFHVAFRKHAPTDRTFDPFYSWDGSVELDATAFRKGVHGVHAATIVQTVGTENLGRQVSVGATGYVLGFGYVNTSFPVLLSVSFRHLSSHLTQDLDRKEEEVTRRGGRLPAVADPSDLNVVYVKAAGTLSRVPLTPHVSVVLAPISFRFSGGEAGQIRPLFVETSWPLVRWRGSALVAETQHEVGPNAFDTYLLGLHLARRDQSRGRIQIFFSVSPGDGFHISPHAGGVVDGVAVGVRVSLAT
jgi:hypothetical protein